MITEKDWLRHNSVHLQEVIGNEALIEIIQSAVNNLLNIKMFSVLLELGALRNAAGHSKDPLANTALRGAWMDGYSEALRDLFCFNERYMKGTPFQQVRAGFNAANDLLNDGEITKEEHDRLSKS